MNRPLCNAGLTKQKNGQCVAALPVE